MKNQAGVEAAPVRYGYLNGPHLRAFFYVLQL